jgi:hypothetical protein
MPLRPTLDWIPSRIQHVATLSLVALLLLPALAPPLAAQGLGRKLQVEANANLSFGNVDQSTMLTRLGASTVDSLVEMTLDAAFTYGETRLDGTPTVAKRSWMGSLSADLLPFSQVTPFMLATIESSLEKRIVRRYAGGGGAKLVFVKRDGFTSDLSVALLAERSVLAASDSEQTETLYARYSTQYRLERKIDDRITASFATSYRPEFRALHRFTASANAALLYRVAAELALKASVVDNYDSEARSRGARSDNDGDVLFGCVATF